ncbi:polysaccharide pyruvyl transferase family protein [Alteromonas gracilis]|uniref:polysaccharide pyruvyl transferase family protein n=1 Tax=Alteromonas gracilis TaxID=1479524 RepID=UPI003219D065
MKSINVLASVKKPNSEKGNLGDLFGYMLMEYYAKQYSLSVNRLGVDDELVSDTFAVVGSIIHLCQKKAKLASEDLKLIVLGCGLIKGDKMPQNDRIEYVGVRGPSTRELLPTKTEVMSDPGLLLSKMFPLPNNHKCDEVGYIIHSVDREHFFAMYPEARKNLINNYANYEDFLEQLSRYKYVVSSSLHGVIFCHAYNIPVCSIRVTDKIISDNFKYTDYYHSIGHTAFKARQPIDEKTEFKQLVIDEWQPTKEKIASVQERQEQVIRHAIETFAIDGTQD